MYEIGDLVSLAFPQLFERPSSRLLLSRFHAVVWIAAVVAATLARLDLNTGAVPWARALITGVAMAVVFTMVGWLLQLHQGRTALGIRNSVLVVETSNGGRQLIRSKHRDGSSRWNLVGLLVNNPYKRYPWIDRVLVLERSADLAPVADQTGTAAVVVAIPDHPPLIRWFRTSRFRRWTVSPPGPRVLARAARSRSPNFGEA